MQAGDRQQRRDRRVVLVHAAVGEDEDVLPLGDQSVRPPRRDAPSLFPGRPRRPSGLKSDRERDRRELALRDVLELRKFLVAEDRRLELDQVTALRFGLQQVALRPDGGDRRRDDFLADAVDGRVRHLGEELLESNRRAASGGPKARRAACQCPWIPPLPRHRAPSGPSAGAGLQKCSRTPSAAAARSCDRAAAAPGRPSPWRAARDACPATAGRAFPRRSSP